MPRYGFRSGKGTFDKLKLRDSGVIAYTGTGTIDIEFKYEFKKPPVMNLSWDDAGGGNDFVPYIDYSAHSTKETVIHCRKSTNRAVNASELNNLWWSAYERTYSS